MLTFAQIAAILSLLLAFGAPVNEVANVRTILTNAHNSVVSIPADIPQITETTSVAPEAPACPSVPTITVKPETGYIEGDTITLPIKYGYQYLDVYLTDSCVDFTQLNFTFESPLQTFTSWTNANSNSAAFGVTFSSSTQEITITASEPQGQVVTRTISVQEQ